MVPRLSWPSLVVFSPLFCRGMNNFLSKYLNALLNAPKIDVALFTFSHIWLSNVSSESIVTPMSFFLNPLNIFSR